MIKELLSIFRSDNPLHDMGEDFAEMMRLARELTTRAGDAYFGEPLSPEERTELYKRDVSVNKLQRTIRKRVIAHLSLRGTAANLPYCLLLMSLVKDVERIGDYCKNLAELREIHPDPLPEGPLLDELREIRKGVETAFASTADVFARSDRDAAAEFIQAGRDLAHRADALVETVAASDYNARDATALALGARHYKRIGGHLLNVLSGVVMPLHKLDYYDERELDE